MLKQALKEIPIFCFRILNEYIYCLVYTDTCLQLSEATRVSEGQGIGRDGFALDDDLGEGQAAVAEVELLKDFSHFELLRVFYRPY